MSPSHPNLTIRALTIGRRVKYTAFVKMCGCVQWLTICFEQDGSVSFNSNTLTTTATIQNCLKKMHKTSFHWITKNLTSVWTCSSLHPLRTWSFCLKQSHLLCTTFKGKQHRHWQPFSYIVHCSIQQRPDGFFSLLSDTAHHFQPTKYYFVK